MFKRKYEKNEKQNEIHGKNPMKPLEITKKKII